MKTSRDFYKEMAIGVVGGTLVGVGIVLAIEGAALACLALVGSGWALIWAATEP